MQHQEFSFAGADAVPLFAQTWQVAPAPRALVALVHGATEHSNRYLGLVQPLLTAGFAVGAFDLRGHGRSGGLRGHVNRWQDFSTDLAAFVRVLRTRYTSASLFLYGHSLGALILLAYLTAHGSEFPRGIVLSGTAVGATGGAGPLLCALTRALCLIRPLFRIPTHAHRRRVLSRDPLVEAEFKCDPLVLQTVTARFAEQAFALMATIRQNASQIAVPALGVHGGADPLASVRAAEAFFARLSSRDKRLIVYPGGLHEPHQDLDRADLFSRVTQWIAERA